MDLTDVPERAERETWAAEIAGVLTDLPDRQADALRFAYFDGPASTEIAERMGTSAGEAARTLAGALLRLGRLLQT